MVALLNILTIPLPLLGQETVLAYFKAGIQRTEMHQQSVIIEPSMEDALHSIGISINDVSSAFPDFDEADTVMQTDEGPVARMNMAHLFQITVPHGLTGESLVHQASANGVRRGAMPHRGVSLSG